MQFLSDHTYSIFSYYFRIVFDIFFVCFFAPPCPSVLRRFTPFVLGRPCMVLPDIPPRYLWGALFPLVCIVPLPTHSLNCSPLVFRVASRSHHKFRFLHYLRRPFTCDDSPTTFTHAIFETKLMASHTMLPNRVISAYANHKGIICNWQGVCFIMHCVCNGAQIYRTIDQRIIACL